MKRLLFALLMAMVTLSSAHQIGQTHLDWNHDGLDVNGNPENLVGFTIYYGSTPGVYPNAYPVTDPTARSVNISAFAQADGEYYCVVKAVDADGNESAPTGEVHFFVTAGAVVLPAAPAAPYNLTIGQ